MHRNQSQGPGFRKPCLAPDQAVLLVGRDTAFWRARPKHPPALRAPPNGSAPARSGRAAGTPDGSSLWGGT